MGVSTRGYSCICLLIFRLPCGSKRVKSIPTELTRFFFHQVVGLTTSGSYSYQLKKSMCFAYLPASLTQLGSRVEVEMLGSKFPAVVVQQPLFAPEPIRAKTS